MKREHLITKRDFFETRIKFLKQQVEHHRMHNNNHYCHKKGKKMNRIKKSDEQEIINYRLLNT